MLLKLECYIQQLVINSVLKSLIKLKVKKIILDPVMITKGGTKLINNNSN